MELQTKLDALAVTEDIKKTDDSESLRWLTTKMGGLDWTISRSA